MTGRLVLCGTPIGNLGDITRRALEVLQGARVVACEDTRRTRKLLAAYGIPAPELVVVNEATERRAVPGLVRRMEAGEEVVLVSDAGMPGLSDPGYRLVSACVGAGVEVTVVPGPSSALSALVVSGLPPARFTFEGFLPRKASERRRRIAELAAEERTIVLFESPHRAAACLRDLLEGLGDRRAAVARELTKVHESVHRGRLSELVVQAEAGELIGELVVVVEGARRTTQETPDAAALARRARALMRRGMDRRAALAAVAREAGVARREVFDALIEHPEGEEGS